LKREIYWIYGSFGKSHRNSFFSILVKSLSPYLLLIVKHSLNTFAPYNDSNFYGFPPHFDEGDIWLSFNFLDLHKKFYFKVHLKLLLITIKVLSTFANCKPKSFNKEQGWHSSLVRNHSLLLRNKIYTFTFNELNFYVYIVLNFRHFLRVFEPIYFLTQRFVQNLAFQL